MKKLMITAIIAFGLFFTADVAAQEIAMTDTEITSQERTQDEYQKIEAAQIPQAVKDAVARDFEGATIAEAFVGKDRTYKLVLNAAGEKRTVFADANGNWIDKK